MPTTVGADLQYNTRGRYRETTTTLVFTGNYPDEGETVTPQQLGLSTVLFAEFDGSIAALDGETALQARYNVATQKVEIYESGASGAALIEKTGAEAYPAAANVRITAVGW